MKALALSLIALLAAVLPAAAVQGCAQHRTRTCLFGKAVLFDKDVCGPIPCQFDATKELRERCALPETGTFSYSTAPAAGCTDPFMSSSPAALAQCGARCCRADYAGDFSASKAQRGSSARRLSFRPAGGRCRYAELSRGQVLDFLRVNNADVVVIGDSLARQLHGRLVQALRGQTRLLDYNIHTHSQYLLCDEADAFRIAAPSPQPSSTVENNTYLQASLVPFLRVEAGPGAAAARAAVARCSRRPVHVPFIWAPRFATQGPSLEKYFEAALPGSKPVVVTYIGYWERAKRPPSTYLATLSALRGRAISVVIVGVPTARETRADRAADYAARNAFMRQWVARQGEPYLFLDYDALSQAAHPPPGGADFNPHYMCAAEWGPGTEIDPGGGAGAVQIPRGELRRVRTTEDGLCADEMNRNLWQIIFNAVVQPGRGAAAPPAPEPEPTPAPESAALPA